MMKYTIKCSRFLFWISIILLELTYTIYASIGSVNWECHQDLEQCRRVIGPETENNLTLQACRLTCGTGNTLWPYPSGPFDISKSLMPVEIDFRTRQLHITFEKHFVGEGKIIRLGKELENILLDALLNTSDQYYKSHRAKNVNINNLNIKVTIAERIGQFDYETYEGYSLKKENQNADVVILAQTYQGYRNAIFTLVQLIIYDEIRSEFMMPESFHILDYPDYPHRGVMLDVSQNFVNVPALYRLMTSLSYSKINTVHLQLAGAGSFPLMTFRHPEFAYYGAYGADKIYHYGEMMAMAQFSKLLGIRLIPEVPIPGPIGAGWYRDPSLGLGDLVVCHDEMPYSSKCKDPPCGQLNLENENAIQLMKDLYKDLIGIFGPTIYHLGGGVQVDSACWKSLNTEEAHRRWAALLNDVADMIIEKGGQVIVYSNELLHDQTEWLSPQKFIIQVIESNDEIEWVQQLIARGYQIILSPVNLVRWDCGYGPYSPLQNQTECGRMVGWHSAYNIDVQNKVAGYYSILGAEGLLYSYQTHSYNVEERMILRAAGLAERFWTNPFEHSKSYLNAYPRIGYHAWLLNYFGYHVEGVEPYWCTQNTGKCLLGE